MNGRTCKSPSLASARKPAPQPSTPGWAVPERASNAPAPDTRFATVMRMPPRSVAGRRRKEPRRSPRPTAMQERIETWFEAGAWSEDLADSYLALGRVDDAVRMISDATRSGHAEGAEMPYEPAEKLMRSGTSPPGQAPVAAGSRRLPDDVRIHVQAGIGYGDIGDHAGAL